MENNLELCIALYEQEKSQLQLMIKECLDDVEGPYYLTAHYYQQALFKTSRILDRLYKIKDPLYPKKESIQRQISKYETRIKEFKNQGTDNDYILKLKVSEPIKKNWLSHLENDLSLKLNDLKTKLDQLNKQPTESTLHTENPILTYILRDLIEKRITTFKLILNRSINFYLHFFYKKNQVNIMFPNIKFLLKNHHLWKSQIDHLQKIGFIQVNSNRLQYSLRISNIEDINKIKLLLTKIIYEVFFEDQFRNEHFIEY